MRRCVFFDRDGIVNRSPGEGLYVERWEDFELLPDFVDVLRLVRQRGYVAVVATNQRGVSRGLMTEAEVARIHDNLCRVLTEKYGLELLDVMCCPHAEGQCQCRKPQPGLLLEAARRHDLDLSGSWMIGDTERDVEAGRRAGCRTVLVAHPDQTTNADFHVADLRTLATLLNQHL